MKSALSTIENIIDEARQGRMFILCDAEHRENEGDLVIPAAAITPHAVNFMATHGRGLICLAMEASEIDRLGLPLMAEDNSCKLGTAFTVSIDAKDHVSTGISAIDRSRTIAMAASPKSRFDDFSMPGHVFPLRARNRGTLERAGHTEASIDIAKLAGFNGAAAICEIMNDDGTMARLPNLMKFAKKHGLKIGTIADLVEYLEPQRKSA